MRKQILITEIQNEMLKEYSNTIGVSMSEYLRRILEYSFEQQKNKILIRNLDGKLELVDMKNE